MALSKVGFIIIAMKVNRKLLNSKKNIIFFIFYLRLQEKKKPRRLEQRAQVINKILPDQTGKNTHLKIHLLLIRVYPTTKIKVHMVIYKNQGYTWSYTKNSL